MRPLAALLLVAALAVLVSALFSDGLYRYWAYEDGHVLVEEAGHYESNVPRDARKKRMPSLPGPEYLPEGRRCHNCGQDHHSRCPGRFTFRAERGEFKGSSACLCQDRHHEFIFENACNECSRNRHQTCTRVWGQRCPCKHARHRNVQACEPAELLALLSGDSNWLAAEAGRRIRREPGLVFEAGHIERAARDCLRSGVLARYNRGPDTLALLEQMVLEHRVTACHGTFLAISELESVGYHGAVRAHRVVASLATTPTEEQALVKRFEDSSTTILEGLRALGQREYRDHRETVAEATVHGTLMGRHDAEDGPLRAAIDALLEEEKAAGALPSPHCPLGRELQEPRAARDIEAYCEAGHSLADQLEKILSLTSFMYDSGPTTRRWYRRYSILGQRGPALLYSIYERDRELFATTLHELYPRKKNDRRFAVRPGGHSPTIPTVADFVLADMEAEANRRGADR